MTGCEDEAYNFLNNFPIQPSIICAGPGPGFGQGMGSARECGFGGRIDLGDLISDGGAFVPPTAGEVASFSVDTRASTASVVPGSAARVKISILNAQAQTIATKTFAASINNGILKIVNPSAVSNWLANYAHAVKVRFDAEIDQINEDAGQTNSFVASVKYLSVTLQSAGVIWSAPCYHDPDSGLTSPNQCVYGGT